MPYSAHEVISALERKGFAEVGGDHVRLVYQTLDGRDTHVMTKVSRGAGGRDVGQSLLGKMARQVHLTSGEFRNLVDCPLDRVGYEALLVERGIVPPP
ncbi:MAG TPA: hypothetical protein DCZ72_14075 [Armatimonadetes bacterium]|nr:hypothetical protein [Armatimonadota bacterium]